ncbi:sulfotransferase [Frateuria soli]|uniref:sulfotransferase n=1 Tax=Frateuria soli TaxID=1542730 RepID=UPI001E4C44CB|nr:sulfotransferase [Frateuria soli]UGB38524.1 sulfotransferase [Frateuria soli]
MNQRLNDWIPEPLRRGGRSVRQFYRHRSAKPCPRPVLIGGNQKSGTTAIAALLAKATGLRFSNDPFWSIACLDANASVVADLLARRQHIGHIVRRYPAYFSAEIIKDPNFSYVYPQLSECFPRSPQVFIVRDPRQNIRSILDRLGIDGQLDTLGTDQRRALAAGWRAFLDGEGLDIDQGNHVERLAQRWNIVVDRFLERSDAIRLVRYEDFLADKAGCIGELAGHLGLAVRHDIRAEQDRQFQPRGNRAITPEAFFSGRNLAAIESICAGGMARFGYAPRM